VSPMDSQISRRRPSVPLEASLHSPSRGSEGDADLFESHHGCEHDAAALDAFVRAKLPREVSTAYYRAPPDARLREQYATTSVVYRQIRDDLLVVLRRGASTAGEQCEVGVVGVLGFLEQLAKDAELLRAPESPGLVKSKNGQEIRQSMLDGRARQSRTPRPLQTFNGEGSA